MRKLLQPRIIAYNFVEWKDGVEGWKFEGSKYSAATVWFKIRPKMEKKEWHRLVWSSLCIPKHAMITWMAILDRLPTMDRLLSWGLATDGNCKLCQIEPENRDHLFFGCSFSRGIWRTILQLCGLNRRMVSWTEELDWAMQKFKGKALISVVLRLAWRAFIYHVWRERNRRMHEQQPGDHDQLVEHIKNDIRLRLNGLQNISNDLINYIICQNWGLQLDN